MKIKVYTKGDPSVGLTGDEAIIDLGDFTFTATHYGYAACPHCERESALAFMDKLKKFFQEELFGELTDAFILKERCTTNFAFSEERAKLVGSIGKSYPFWENSNDPTAMVRFLPYESN